MEHRSLGKREIFNISQHGFVTPTTYMLTPVCLLQTLTEEERKLFSLYGKLPTHKNVLTKIQKVCSRVHKLRIWNDEEWISLKRSCVLDSSITLGP